jgi:hypothetical protein
MPMITQKSPVEESLNKSSLDLKISNEQPQPNDKPKTYHQDPSKR